MHARSSRWWTGPSGIAIAAFAMCTTSGCPSDPTRFDGEYGRAIRLATGDASALPRLAFIDHGCAAEAGRGGCTGTGEGACEPVLLDSLSPLTFFKRDDDGATLSFGRECLELREAGGLAADPPSDEDLARAVAHFRFRDLPVVRAPSDGAGAFAWAAGNQDATIEPSGVIGGNLLRLFAVELRRPRMRAPAVALYGEFPGTDRNLADEGFAYMPVQFPGRLLGRDLSDRCEVGSDDCELGGFDIQGNPDLALEASRMVLDACVAVPPCGVRYDLPGFDPTAVGVCSTSRGPRLREADDPEAACVPADDPQGGGVQATLVVATGVPGLVLFDDSARRMFGPLEDLPDCDAIDVQTRACLLGQDGSLSISGWPPAPEPNRPPLLRMSVRSVALLPGLTRTRGEGPCVRAQKRMNALQEQCDNFVGALDNLGTIEDTRVPYASADSDAALAVVGETQLGPESLSPDPARWIDVLVLPQTHALPLALRRDVAPEALQPDGLLGTALLDDTVTVLDYTDPNPGVRARCLNPRSGDCLVAPSCTANEQAACCFGLPLDLLVEYIVFDDDTCCSALSAEELTEIQDDGFCRGASPP